MSDQKTIDQAIKGMDPNKEIITTDFINLDKSVYVSRKDKAELATDASIGDGSNERAFNAMAKKIKQEFDTPVIVGASDATHYNFVNDNMSFYMIEFMARNAKTWVPTTGGIKLGKPWQLDHDISTESTVGRVLAATPFFYPNPNPNNLKQPDGHIELIYYISDSDTIEKVMDGRLKTISVSAGTHPDNVTCSICGLSARSWDCDHIRGKVYPAPDLANPKAKPKDKMAFWVWGEKDYKESSYVSQPADKFAIQKKTSLINIPGIDASDSIDYNYNNDEFKRILFFLW